MHQINDSSMIHLVPASVVMSQGRRSWLKHRGSSHYMLRSAYSGGDLVKDRYPKPSRDGGLEGSLTGGRILKIRTSDLLRQGPWKEGRVGEGGEIIRGRTNVYGCKPAGMKILQFNLHYCRVALTTLSAYMLRIYINVQEPWVIKGKVAG